MPIKKVFHCPKCGRMLGIVAELSSVYCHWCKKSFIVMIKDKLGRQTKGISHE